MSHWHLPGLLFSHLEHELDVAAAQSIRPSGLQPSIPLDTFFGALRPIPLQLCPCPPISGIKHSAHLLHFDEWSQLVRIQVRVLFFSGI